MAIVTGIPFTGRRMVWLAAALAGLASAASAQTTFNLTVFTSAGGYLGTAQVTSSPSGIDCRSESSGYVVNAGTCTAEFAAGSTVSLTTTPLYGGTFHGWVGACAGQGATCQLQMTAALETSPKTVAKTYTLTILGTGNSRGSIRSVDLFARPRLNCQIGPDGVTSGVCTTEIPANQWAWLGRDDGAPYVQFAGFSPGCDPAPGECMLFMDRPRTITAGWNAFAIIIDPSSISSGTGKVTGVAPNHPIGSFDCTITTQATGACSAKWEDRIPPMSVTLTATPTGNSTFLGWGPGCTGAGSVGNVCVVPLQYGPVHIRPAFETPIYMLAVGAAGSGSGEVVSTPARIDCTITGGVPDSNCASLFEKGTTVTLTAAPVGGSTFGGWTGACSGAALTCTIAINAQTLTTARFVAPRPAAELALALLGRISLTPDEQRELDRAGNGDGAFNLGDLIALLARTGERLSGSTLSALVQAQNATAAQRGDGRVP